ncbi:MAG: prephenate dehydrogenase/arogenate dehydrogenase family protein [Candidatus Velthaea sp.]
MNVERIGIAGVGLIGGSIALRARQAGLPVIGYDRDAAVLSRALASGAIDAAAPDLERLARDSQTLVIALPVDATRAALLRLAGTRGPALVMDVASVKAPLAAAGSEVANYLGTHPMAGREQGGLGFANPALFDNATWAHMPHPDAELVAKTRAFIASMGALPLEIDPERHDAIVALTSHLPQALAVLLGSELAAAARDDRRVMELCGPGMMTMLRLARSPQNIWAPIVTANAQPIAKRLRSIARAIDAAAAALEADESAPLMAQFALAREAVEDLEERIVPSPRS